MKYILLSFFFLVLSITGISQAVIYQENFESGTGTFTLNAPGPGTNIGSNEWIVDTNYFAGGLYPNTNNEDSTFGGSISYAPYGHYLHIYDAASPYVNDNYNPSNASDRFAYMTNSICTKGLENVTLNFFYLCQGSATASGQVYYSKNNGPWTPVGATLNNRYKWQYSTITNPQFNDCQLQFGYRWQNNAGAGKDTSALGIDDIIVTAQYDSVTNPITGKIINITGTDSVCPGQFVELQYTLSDTLCDAEWNLELSNGSGTFSASPPAIWIQYNGPSYGYTTTGYCFIDMPSPLPIGSCYRFKMSRTTWPFITIYDSVCLVVKNCPTSIITQQPSVTLDTNAVCAGSVIDVPFTSSGTFGNLNVYYAQLSDSAGNFLTHYNLSPVGLISNQDYSFPPGSVSGLIPLNVPDGCNYYVRVVADTPTTTGAVWGPFCIQHCDILTNNLDSVHACEWSCYKNPRGTDDSIGYNIHEYDNNEHYNPGNKFEVQLLNSQYMTLVNVGALGVKIDTTSARFLIHIPCADSLTNIYGISPGAYYMRIIATNSNMPDSTLGNLVRFSIGEPADSLDLQVVFPSSTGPFCLNTDIDVLATPYRYMVSPYNSTYTWTESTPSLNYTFPNYPYGEISLVLNGTQTFELICQETNYGCKGPKEELTDSITIQGPPSVAITGPRTVCIGDTGVYSVPFNNNSYYLWTVRGNAHPDTANNIVKIKFDSVETVTVRIHASDSCFPDENDSIKVKVIAKPVPAISANPSTSFCNGTSVTLTASGGSSYAWSNGKRTSKIVVTPTKDTAYWVSVANAGCAVKDTVNITVYQYPTLNVGYCVGDTVIMNASGANTYKWLPPTGLIINDSIAKAIINAPQTYTIVGTTNGCADTVDLYVNPALRPDTIGTGQSILEGQSVQLEVKGGTKWYWSPSTGLNNDTIQDPIASPTVTTVYTVLIKNSTGCSVIDTITVDVGSYCNIFVPNVFAPSDPNNHNTILYVRSECLTSIDFTIFDRWGLKVFESYNLSDGWDGTYKGSPLNPGTFVYYATGKTADGKTLTKKGNVTLVR